MDAGGIYRGRGEESWIKSPFLFSDPVYPTVRPVSCLQNFFKYRGIAKKMVLYLEKRDTARTKIERKNRFRARNIITGEQTIPCSFDNARQ